MNDIYNILDRLSIVFKNIGISNEKVNIFPIRYGEESEFEEDVTAFCNDKEIVVKKNMSYDNTLSNIVHEIGHEVTIFGRTKFFGDTLAEATAYNFQKRCINKFNEIENTNLTISMLGNLISRLKEHPSHEIGWFLSKFIPLGFLIKRKYKV